MTNLQAIRQATREYALGTLIAASIMGASAFGFWAMFTWTAAWAAFFVYAQDKKWI